MSKTKRDLLAEIEQAEQETEEIRKANIQNSLDQMEKGLQRLDMILSSIQRKLAEMKGDT